VGHGHQCLARPAELAEQPEDVAGGAAVQVAGGLVGEQHQRLVDQGSGHRDALLLAAREVTGEVTGPRGHAQPFQQLHRPATRRTARHADEQRRQLHVLHRGQLVDQVERLEHKADVAAPEDRPARLREAVNPHAAQRQLASVGTLQPAQQVQQGRLAAAARAHDRDRFTRLDHQVHAVHGPDRRSVAPIAPHQASRLEHRAHYWTTLSAWTSHTRWGWGGRLVRSR
jgi:hypothetical protein